MTKALKTLRAVQWAMLASILFMGSWAKLWVRWCGRSIRL